PRAKFLRRNLPVTRAADAKRVDKGEKTMQALVTRRRLRCERMNRTHRAATHGTARERHHDWVGVADEVPREHVRAVRGRQPKLEVTEVRWRNPPDAVLQEVAQRELVDAAEPPLLLNQVERAQSPKRIRDGALRHSQLFAELPNRARTFGMSDELH